MLERQPAEAPINLFILDVKGYDAAKMLTDQHLAKMIEETAQILDGGTRPIMANLFPRTKHTLVPIPHANRDNQVIHSGSSRVVWDWAWDHFRGLLHEFHYRFDANHEYANPKLHEKLLDRLTLCSGHMTNAGFVLDMPSQYKVTPDKKVPLAVAMASYRDYYAHEKMLFGYNKITSTWRLRPPPLWLDNARAKLGDRRALTSDGRLYLYTEKEAA